MSKLPRTRILANKNLTKNTRTIKSNLKKDTTALNVICDKYNIKELTFRSVQFITIDGTITTIEHNTIKGNINHGIFLIESSSASVALDKIYDIVTIKNDKKTRDYQKKVEAQNKAKPEMERLNQQMINDLKTLNNFAPATTNIDNNVAIDENNNDTINVTSDAIDAGIIENAPVVNKKLAKTTGNKFFRNFMKDVKGKFKLSFQDEYEYCEFRKDATDMIIEGVNIHKINIPNDLSYYIIIGSMQMKRIAIKQIDPAYGADDVIDEHNEFMDRVTKNDIIDEKKDLTDDVPDLITID